jgi:hypothetical protein
MLRLKSANSDRHQWLERDHERFIKLKDEYDGQEVGKYSLFMERLKLEMPHISQKIISQHFEWCCSNSSFIEKKHALHRSFEIHTEKLIAETIANILNEEEDLKNVYDRENEQMKQLAVMEEKHEKVKEWRLKKVESLLKLNSQRQEELAESIKAEEKNKAIQENRRLALKQNLQEYHSQLMRKKQEEEEVQNQLRLKYLEHQKVIAKVFCKFIFR